MKLAISIRPATVDIRLEQGFSLVELMVAMVIGLIVLLVVGTLFMNSRQTYLAQDANSRLQENARYVTELFGRQVRSAGYVAINFNPLSGANLFAPTTSTKFNGTAISGVEISAGSDTITLSYDGDKDCLGQLATKPINLFRVNASSQLECVAGGNTGVILGDVESMQVTYREKDQATYKVASAVTMANVSGVRLCLLLRAKGDSDKRAIEAGVNQSYVDCSGATVIKSDGYVRRAITTAIALRNNLMP
jgi:type IV pilus assembly protein PilW